MNTATVISRVPGLCKHPVSLWFCLSWSDLPCTPHNIPQGFSPISYLFLDQRPGQPCATSIEIVQMLSPCSIWRKNKKGPYVTNLNEMIRKVQPRGCACRENSPLFQIPVVSFPLLRFPESPWAQVCTAWTTQAHPAVTSVRPSGVCLPGEQEGEPSHMWVCLPYLFMSASVSVQCCFVLFVFYSV